ncbi:MAG: hypothetical protein RR550_03730 [Rikenellaceae bacterium]
MYGRYPFIRESSLKFNPKTLMTVQMKKNLLQIVLAVLIVFAGYLLYNSLNTPIVFARMLQERSDKVIEKLKDIRIIERAYKVKYGTFADDFDELIRFIKNDSLVYEVATGSMDDSVAVAEGRVSSTQMLFAAKDTLFSGRTVNFDELALVPFTDGKKFILGINNITTESGVEVNVFEAYVDYETLLWDWSDRQDLINLYDEKKTQNRFEGIKVGSLEKANNDAGSWEN